MRRFEKEDILLEDEAILVVRKHAGMAVQSARPGQMDLEHELLNYLAAGGRTQGRRMPYLGVIHRLDQPVEGVLVFAKTSAAAARLNDAMKKNRIEKTYLAVTDRMPGKQEAVLVDYLKKDGRRNLSFVTNGQEPDARRAELSYRVLQSVQEEERTWFLIEVKLRTGRHHQIRVQMSHAGMPLCGDEKYYPEYEKKDREEGLALCAYTLSFPHPVTGKKLTFRTVPEGKAFLKFGLQK